MGISALVISTDESDHNAVSLSGIQSPSQILLGKKKRKEKKPKNNEKRSEEVIVKTAK